MIDRRTVLITAAATGLAGMVMNRAGQAQGQAKQKIQAIGFDGFTIFDPSSLNKAMEDHFPDRGAQLSTLWRTRQFEYCWLRTLNGKYADFWQVSDDSLEWAFKTAHVELTASVKSDLIGGTSGGAQSVGNGAGAGCQQMARTRSPASLWNGRLIAVDQKRPARRPTSAFDRCCRKRRKSNDAKNLANCEFWTTRTADIKSDWQCRRSRGLCKSNQGDKDTKWHMMRKIAVT
jgi:hypothetical protein